VKKKAFLKIYNKKKLQISNIPRNVCPKPKPFSLMHHQERTVESEYPQGEIVFLVRDETT